MIEKTTSWKDVEILVPFFNKLAVEKGFHPTSEYERWYDIKKSDLQYYKVIKYLFYL